MHDLSYEFYIAAAPDRVWNALVSPAETVKLYEGSTIKSTFAVGSPMEYVGPDQHGNEVVHIYGTVLAFEPGRTFSHTCKIGEVWGPGREKFESRVTYQLEPVGPCTKLTATHDRWMDGDPAHKGSVAGWPKLLSSLKSLVETGKPLELPDAH